MTKLFNFDPYYDDFNEDRNFMRILFRPGYSVQARELTQLQTILSNQIEKFGNHIFKNGSPIIGGKVSLDDRAYYLIVNTQYNNEDVVLETFLNKIVVSYNSSKIVRAKVIAIDNTVSSTPILILKYLSGDFFEEEDELKIYGENVFAQARTDNAVGRSYIASIQDGVYYFKGQFVKVTPQFLVLEAFYRLGYNTETVNVQPSYKIGIEFEELVIDEIDDTSLLDPAQGSFNYQAPGATRYQLNPILSKRTLDSTDESSFFEVIRIVNGIKTKEIDYPIYNEIEKTLARRTFEESGNYTVDPFVISLEEDYVDTSNNNYVDPNYFSAVLDPGKAYVGGYEVQTIAPTTIGVYRGRETANVVDFDLPTSYGSYIYVKNVHGTIPISSFPLLDIHCVPRNSIDSSDDAAYNSTKIGSLRCCMLKYDDYNTSRELGSSHVFTMNIFDVNSNSITGNLPSSGSTSSEISLPLDFSSTLPANAYSGMYFSIRDGAGQSIAPIQIISSGSGNLTLSTTLPFTPQSNAFSIDSDFKVAESITTRSGSYLGFGANIDEKSKDLDGNSVIIDRNRQGLIFNVPFDALKPASIDNLDIITRKLYSNKISVGSSGLVELETIGDDTFPFDPSSSTDILNNIICFIKPGGASNSASGLIANTIVSLANNLFSVTSVTSKKIDINLNTGGVLADFIVTTKINDAENGGQGAVRTKQLYPLNDDFHEKVAYQLNLGVDTLTLANTGSVTAVSGGYIFPDIGAVFYSGDTSASDPVRQLRTPGVPVSLHIPDVYEIVKIIDSKTPGNVTTTMLNDPTYDVTERYELDTGQRRTHYDHATIKLKRGYSSPTGGSMYIIFKYFRHGQAPSPQNIGLFTVDSYSNVDYSNIPNFIDKEGGKLISGRSAFDFRPTRDIASNNYSGAVNPDPNSTSEVSFEHYLSRIDRLVVKPSKEIALISGKSDVNPTPPVIKNEDMLIYTLYVPPYTESVKEVRADFQNNKRFTMRDIGAFENRIKSLEYYVALNTLEKNANDSKILDANGLERSKYGILVDNFTSNFTQANYSDAGFDNRCLVDGGELQPASLMRTFKLRWIESASTGSYKVIGTNTKKSLILNYTEQKIADQPFATKTIPIASALFGNFNGTLKLFPEFTSDQDTSVTARVTLNSVQGLENAFNFVNEGFRFISDQNPSWVNDKDNPFAKFVDSSWFETKTTTTNETVNLGGNLRGNLNTTTDRLYITKGAELNQKQIGTSSTEVNVGDFVTDVAINPYLKPRMISFTGSSLRPNTRFYSYFDGVLVDRFVVAPTKVKLSIGPSEFRSGELGIIGTDNDDINQQFAYYLNESGPYNLVYISSSESNSSNVSVVNETGLTLSGKILFGIDSRAKVAIDSVIEHKSGITRTITSNTIQLASDGPSTNISGQTLTLVRYSYINNILNETGYGKQYQITSYNTSTKVATISGETTSAERTGEFVYSIGNISSNKFGDVGGVFYPPAATFRSGERVFRLTESFNNTYDRDAISFADKSFVSSGVSYTKTRLVDTVYNVDVGVKMIGNATSPILTKTTVNQAVTRTWRVDPLAQTFFIDEEVYPNGLYLSSVSIFFSAKDDELPVRVQIRPTENGIPSSDFWYPESVVDKKPSEITVTQNPSVDAETTKTKFDFESPVFLRPGLYALVVLCDTPNYSLWTAEKGQITLTNQLVSINPYVGTLYKSQNAMEFTPYLNEDLMFEMNRCVFSKSPATFVLHNEKQQRLYYIDKFRVLQRDISSLSSSPLSLSYSFASTPINGSVETIYRPISPDVVYNMGTDNLYSLGNKRKKLINQGDFRVAVTMSTTDDSISPLVSLESLYLNAWENFIDEAEITVDDFNIIAPGSGYSNSNVVTINSTTGTGAEIYLKVDGVNGNVVGLNVQSSGINYIDNFTISIPNTSHPSGNITSNAVITLNSEHDSAGGPCLARYITKPITLADGFDAGDIRIYLSAHKPSGTEIHVFCKLLSSSDITEFKDRVYQELVCINPRSTPPTDFNEFLEFEYRPSLTEDFISYTSFDGVTHDTFKTFSIKIVMISRDPSVIPRVKDLRIIALPAG